MNMEDMFPEFAPISHSQEESLERKRFQFYTDHLPEVTSTYHDHHHDNQQVITTNHIDFLVDSYGVVHAPIEVTYFLSASNVEVPNCSFNTVDDETLELMDFANVDVPNCSLNTVDDETLDLMDFGSNSDIGFQENLLSVEGGDHLAEMDREELGVSQRENSDLGEMNAEDDGPVANEQVVEDGNVVNEQVNVEAVNNDDDVCREIPRRNEQEMKFFVFDVLRVLADAKKVDDENKNLSLLEVVKYYFSSSKSLFEG